MRKKIDIDPQWLGYPALVWFILFICGPLCLILITSVLTKGIYGGIEWKLTLDSYRRVQDPVYFEIFVKSLRLSVVTSILCLAIGYPMAWAMAAVSARYRNLLVVLMAIPFLMNLIIRVYAIRLFVGFDGPLLALLRSMGISHDPFAFSQNQTLVLYGMVTTYLPFMVFPLFAALEKFDFNLLEANYDLGGGHWTAFYRVLLPNTKAAIAGGILLVFIPTMGEFVIPDLLGGAKNMLVGNLITEQFLKSRNWPFGAALSVVLIVILMSMAGAISSWGNRKRKF